MTDIPTTFMCRLSEIWEPQPPGTLRGMSRPVTRIAYGLSVVELRVSSSVCITLYNLVTLTLQQTVLFEKLISENLTKQLLQFLPHEGSSLLPTVRHRFLTCPMSATGSANITSMKFTKDINSYIGCATRYRTRLAGGPLLRVATIRRTTDTHYRHIPLHFSHNERTPVQSSLQYLHWCYNY
jgi:hypothetical protein